MKTIPTLVFGHRNPDTDSVCSAIALSYLKNELGENTSPRVIGHINKETQFVLNYFGIKEPEYLNNVKVQLRNVHYNKGVKLKETASIKEVVDYIQEKHCTAVPIVDDKNRLVSLITLKEIAMLFIEQSREHLNTNYEHLLHALNGREILKFHDEFDGNMIAGSYKSETFIESAPLNKNDILIVGNRAKVIKHGINCKISLLVLTNNFDLPEDLLELAKENHVSVISSSMDTYNTCNAINLSNYVKTILINKSPAVVQELDYLTDFVAEATRLGFTNYPILNKKNECLGLIRITDIGKYDKKDVILVDHNNLEQSVPGIDEANIVEIIDHHNLGAIGTSVPINFRSMPVGCTCTILYYLYQEHKIKIPKEIAGLMLSAIISDTLILKSPTTTERDKEAVENLASIAGVDYKKYGYSMLKAGSSIEGLTVEDLIYQDFKSYKVGNTSLGISQVITMDFDSLKDNIDEYVEKLDEIAKRDYSTVTLFITDIVENGSYVLYNTEAKHIIEDSFDIIDIEEGTFIPDLVSRKKQMLPQIMETLEKNS
ncbi:TPA: putative manganese-dependent inorganic diphosphatase [Candidatus Ventrenecus stercoripullorum]|nr:putative manganese-dependent inorganic diphosphatase [Candidatus Ventrenecus stercoripullorum]